MSVNMIASVTLPSTSLRGTLKVLFDLPRELRPAAYHVGERGRRVPIEDPDAFIDWVSARGSSFFLKAPSVLHDISVGRNSSFAYSAFFKGHVSFVKTILSALAVAEPIFGFGCDYEEYRARNRLTVDVENASCSAWLGRDLTKYICGLYWITLLPRALMERHQVPLEKVKEIALEHDDFGRGQHLFRFYDHPSDWKTNLAIPKILSEYPGFFDIERARPHFSRIRTQAEFLAAQKD
jgi:hypothetical protein